MTNKEMLKYLMKKMETIDERLSRLEKGSPAKRKRPAKSKRVAKSKRKVRLGAATSNPAKCPAASGPSSGNC